MAWIDSGKSGTYRHAVVRRFLPSWLPFLERTHSCWSAHSQSGHIKRWGEPYDGDLWEGILRLKKILCDERYDLSMWCMFAQLSPEPLD